MTKTLDTLLDQFDEYGDRPALLAFQREGFDEWSFARLAQESNTLAQGLSQQGLERGDHVGVFAGPRAEWALATLAILRAGGVVVPIDAQLTGKTLAHVLDDCQPRLVITTASGAKVIDECGTSVEARILLMGEPPQASDDSKESPDVTTLGQLMQQSNGRPQESRESFEPDETAVLFYTSGTTGPPKGVPLSHGNLAYQLQVIDEQIPLNDDDRVLLPLPLHHVYPLVIGLLAPLKLGVAIVMPRTLTGHEIRRALKEGRCSLIVGVPRLYRALISGLDAQTQQVGGITGRSIGALWSLCTWARRRLGLRLGDFLLSPIRKRFAPRVRLVASGGSPLDPELAWRLEGLGWRVAVGYGLTETSPLLTLKRPNSLALESVGPPVPGTELHLDPEAVPSQGEESDNRPSSSQPEAGEVLAQGPGVFGGYHQLPDKTQEAFANEGVFRTGDVGYFDRQGNLCLKGRASTMIVTESGENIQPDQIEEVYEEAEAIREVGVLQTDSGLAALVVPNSRAVEGSDQEDIKNAVREALKQQGKRLASYQRVNDLVLTRESIPRTRLGKIRRHELRDLFERAQKGDDQGAAGPVAIEDLAPEDRELLEDSGARALWDMLAERYPDERLSPDTGLDTELGVDSMEWLDLSLEIGERVGVQLDEEAIARVSTVRDLLEEVAAGSEAEGRDLEKIIHAPEEYLRDDQKRWAQPLGMLGGCCSSAIFWTNRGVMRLGFGLEVRGLEHLPDKGPCIVASNHQSFLDAPALAVALHRASRDRLRHWYWAGAREVMFTGPFIKLCSRLMRVLPIDPQGGATSGLALASLVLRRGDNLVWFPEGTRSFSGELQEFRPGLGLLLAKLGMPDLPIVPVYLEGTFDALRPGTAKLRFRKITVHIGQPVAASELLGRQSGQPDQDESRDGKRHHRTVEQIQSRVEQLATPSTNPEAN